MTNAFQSWHFRSSPDSRLVSLSSSSSDIQGSELDLLQRSLYQKEFQNARHESTWLDSMKQLPFDCTGCGNCCRTTGNVYMSPEEVVLAAACKNITTSEFIDKYAEYELLTSSTKRFDDARAVPWILLQNIEAINTKKSAACIFLDNETNQCEIYSARPIQCSTYPFWSNILESEKNWNAEVRRKHSVDSDEDGIHSNIPVWTPDNGGCEGMKPVESIDAKFIVNESEGVAVDSALQQLSLYEFGERRTPRTYQKKSVKLT
eukprot:CAMPEP_0197186610 /NCGR_PEP_ID=MMETSP1423-20130617/14260_1 /TAXON_ID=476441 /ORGANISM="Pseudo-nitzschia heimii, Strain UNC1101" /LENGTH=260 /DNA_ID=CAMNT_0042637975 /DNA_START=107 /DNA_END=885 /DNA_ORIENTATION=+